MAITRQNPYLAEILTDLDFHLQKYGGDESEAREHLSAADNEFIDEEYLHCMTDTRYFISNYFAYRDEKEGFKGLYPFFDSQEILFEEYRRLEKTYGRVRALVLKARQMGSTTYNVAEFFQKTVFAHHVGSIMVGKDDKQKNKMFSMYSSALDFIPWWMKPRQKTFQTNEIIEFDEKDERLRATRPGLKTIINWENANKPSGAGRGDTFNCALLSELAFWQNGSQLSKSLFPTFNTPDGFYVMESTANGRNDFWHNLWRRAERGEVDWHPIFIPFYRRSQTYSLPILKTEVFVLNEDETQMRERVLVKESFLIRNETFNWMRKRKEEFIATDGDDAMFSQEYTAEPEESFQSSAITAFPRHIIHRFSKLTRNPTEVGEIEYDTTLGKEKLHLKPFNSSGDVPYPCNNNNRFHVWKRPVKGARYSMGVDVGLGNEGGDYSCIQVVRISEGPFERDEQVACWHGLINPSALAGICYSVGVWYNEALAAVEVNSYGEGTNFKLMREYEYENIYRFKRLDRIKNFITDISGWLSTSKSTDSLMASMSAAFLEDTIIINDKWTMDEFNDYTEEGARGKGSHDDMVDALLIALFCGHEGEIRARQEGKSQKKSEDRDRYMVMDRFGTRVGEPEGFDTWGEAERLSKIHPGSSVQRLSGAAAFTTLVGTRRKVPGDFYNTEFSEVHDKEKSAAHRLHFDKGVPVEDITPQMMQEFDEEQEDLANNPDYWKYC
jgi:hypothetical protein